jgi:6-phosphofructokinase 1
MSSATVRVEIPGGPIGGIVADDVAIPIVGSCRVESPVRAHLGDEAMHFVGEADKVLIDDRLSQVRSGQVDPSAIPAFELAGPRNRIFYEPTRVRAGIVTCGGLCPGLNNVIRGLVFELWFAYGVRRILGFRYGYEGLSAEGMVPLELTPGTVVDIHQQGGTFLGSSRGNQDPAVMAQMLAERGVDMLFVVGGDGTIRGAQELAAELKARSLPIAVVGVPKTIDNDIHFIDRSFGFESAYSAAVEVIRAARAEAIGARDGIGLVKLMGRHSGFVACNAVLAAGGVDLVLIPENPLKLEGPGGMYSYVERVLDRQGFAVIVVAEGAAQEHFQDLTGSDKSGNKKLGDVGGLVRGKLEQHFSGLGRPLTVKYLDPSYAIRSVPASPSDSVYCWHMARNAVHAAMAGNTDMLIGRWHGRFVHVPMSLATRARKHVDLHDDLWMSVIEATGQPRAFTG